MRIYSDSLVSMMYLQQCRDQDEACSEGGRHRGLFDISNAANKVL